MIERRSEEIARDSGGFVLPRRSMDIPRAVVFAISECAPFVGTRRYS